MSQRKKSEKLVSISGRFSIAWGVINFNNKENVIVAYFLDSLLNVCRLLIEIVAAAFAAVAQKLIHEYLFFLNVIFNIFEIRTNLNI